MKIYISHSSEKTLLSRFKSFPKKEPMLLFIENFKIVSLLEVMGSVNREKETLFFVEVHNI